MHIDLVETEYDSVLSIFQFIKSIGGADRVMSDQQSH